MNNLSLGTCTKNAEREVLFQDCLCLKTCGDMAEQVSFKGCMSGYSLTSGMTLIKNSIVDNHIIDAVIINDGKTLTTLLYHNKKNANEREKENTGLPWQIYKKPMPTEYQSYLLYAALIWIFGLDWFGEALFLYQR